MKLFMFEHCWLCFRVRMTAALKQKHLQEVVVLDDDTDTMVALVGKRVVPILVKDDGQPMLESMDMVRYIDGLGASVLTGIERPEIARWEAEISPKAARLTQPRYLLLGLPEFATAAALDHYQLRKRRTLGDLVELRAETRRYIAELAPDLEALDRMIESPRAVNGTQSLDGVRVLPILRSLGVVKGLRLPPRVREYFDTMMAGSIISHSPLPERFGRAVEAFRDRANGRKSCDLLRLDRAGHPFDNGRSNGYSPKRVARMMVAIVSKRGLAPGASVLYRDSQRPRTARKVTIAFAFAFTFPVTFSLAPFALPWQYRGAGWPCRHRKATLRHRHRAATMTPRFRHTHRVVRPYDPSRQAGLRKHRHGR